MLRDFLRVELSAMKDKLSQYVCRLDDVRDEDDMELESLVAVEEANTEDLLHDLELQIAFIRSQR
jgi:hypothetical protein